MCVLQDFEALTPNLLARTIETVEVGARGGRAGGQAQCMPSFALLQHA